MSGRDKKPSKPSSSSSNRPGGIRTLSDLNRPSAHDSDSDDAPQEYYTGGEKSGMIVQDPRNRNNVDAIFDNVRQLGATEGLPETTHQPASSSRSFAGAARLLSGEAAPAPVAPAAPQQPEPIVYDITFWRNGFSVNDGPFRRLNDPANFAFIESITNSECPKELEPANRSTLIEIKLHRREGDYTEPERSNVHAPFQGVGRTLGVSTPTETEASTVPAPLHAAPAPSMGLVVDSSQPSTSIQLRLADGTRMVARFNHHHTIANIRAFIDASRPGGARTYQLQAVGFPPKILTDPTQTIEEAGLLNSVVIQKG